jgi:hypothetical protein
VRPESTGGLQRDQRLESSRRRCPQYDGRGTAEQWIKVGMNALKQTKLSCCAFKDDQIRLQLFALDCDLADFLRRLAQPPTVRHWSLTMRRGIAVSFWPTVLGEYLAFDTKVGQNLRTHRPET